MRWKNHWTLLPLLETHIHILSTSCGMAAPGEEYPHPRAVLMHTPTNASKAPKSHGKSSLGSLEAQGQWTHRQGAYAASCAKILLSLHCGGGQAHGQRWYQHCMEKVALRTSVDFVLCGIQRLEIH